MKKEIENKGITLIALVITIIVILLLAGISINMITGQDSILTKANEAKKAQQEAERKDIEAIDEMEFLLGSQEAPWSKEEAEAFAGGDGTQENPYRVENEKQLLYFAEQVNNGETYVGQYISLESDIDLEYKEWIPIGGNSETYEYVEFYFDGNFNGNGHTIKNININEPELYYVGIFGIVDVNGTIENLNVSKGRIVGNMYVGGISGVSGNTIKNCTSNVEVIAQDNSKGLSGEQAGGIVGQLADGTIENCINYGSVITRNDNEKTQRGKAAGGIAGCIYNSTVKDCTNYGDVTSMYQQAGGITGSIDGSNIENCVNEGTVTVVYQKKLSSSGSNAGGIVGWSSVQYFNANSIKNCTNKGKVIGENLAVGGIAGMQTIGNFINCNNEGTIIANCQQTGGISGTLKNGTIEGCKNSGTIIAKYNETLTSSGLFAGGIAGIQEKGNIRECSNIGEITAEVSIAGGIAGRSSGTVSYCWNGGKIKHLSKEESDGTTSYKSGGISGDNKAGTIEYCYNIGSVDSMNIEGTIEEIGGIVGLNRENGKLKYCYTSGMLTGGDAVGGVLGHLYDGTLEKNYYYVSNINTAIGHNGTSYTEVTPGSDITGQAEKISEIEAKTIKNFDDFKTWIISK